MWKKRHEIEDVIKRIKPMLKTLYGFLFFNINFYKQKFKPTVFLGHNADSASYSHLRLLVQLDQLDMSLNIIFSFEVAEIGELTPAWWPISQQQNQISGLADWYIYSKSSWSDSLKSTLICTFNFLYEN